MGKQRKAATTEKASHVTTRQAAARSKAGTTRKAESGSKKNAPPAKMATRATARQAPASSKAAKTRKAESGLENAPPAKMATRVATRQAPADLLAQGHAGSKLASGVREVPTQEKAETDRPNDEEGHGDGVQQQVTVGEISLNQDIENIKNKIDSIEEEINSIKEERRTIQEFLMKVENPIALSALFRQPDKQWIKTIINVDQQPNEQAIVLKKRLDDLFDNQSVLQKRLLLKEQMLTKTLDRNRIFEIRSSKQPEKFRSGLVYIEDKLRIEMGGDESNAIGLLTKENSGTVKVKEVFKVQNLADLLEKAKLDKAWAFKEKDFSSKGVIKNFCKLVPSLSEKALKNACHVVIDEYEFDAQHTPGEMTFQQGICTPFARLLMAAAGEKGLAEPTYKADQHIYSSLSVQRKPKNDAPEQEHRRLRIMPDSSATLYGEWDAFAMMEIKADDPGNRKDDLMDNDRCVLMTAVTAIVLRDCIEPQDYEKVLLPFVIYTNGNASLYVTGLNAEGTPVVFAVVYPDGTDSRAHSLFNSPCIDRKKLFIALALLLNSFKNFFKTSVEEKYLENVKERIASLRNIPTYALTERSACRRNDNDTTGGNPRKNTSRKTPEQYAKEAAEHEGMFSHLVNPFDVFMDFTDNGIKDNVQTVSPFYFSGRTTFSTGDIFLKVWRADEVDVPSVTAEWLYYKQAFKAGVPVPEPVLSELAQSRCSRGFVYLLFAVEFIHEDVIETVNDLWDFSCSLIEAVLMLHQQAKLLHGDIKRDNLRWNRNGVRLIDFEHAQEISNPRFAPGTKGYQAPEILERMPCSRQTDTFSVGKTICKELTDFRKGNLTPEENQKYKLLHEVSARFTALHPDDRWSLRQALFTMSLSNNECGISIKQNAPLLSFCAC